MAKCRFLTGSRYVESNYRRIICRLHLCILVHKGSVRALGRVSFWEITPFATLLYTAKREPPLLLQDLFHHAGVMRVGRICLTHHNVTIILTFSSHFIYTSTPINHPVLDINEI